MRVLAASFPDDASARAARTQLMTAFGLEASQVSVEALAHERNVRDAAVLAGRFQDDVVAAVLAGRFQDDVVAAACEVVERFGGTLVIDIDDGGRNA